MFKLPAAAQEMEILFDPAAIDEALQEKAAEVGGWGGQARSAAGAEVAGNLRRWLRRTSTSILSCKLLSRARCPRRPRWRRRWRPRRRCGEAGGQRAAQPASRHRACGRPVCARSLPSASGLFRLPVCRTTCAIACALPAPPHIVLDARRSRAPRRRSACRSWAAA